MSSETFWVNGEPFSLIQTNAPSTPNTELYWSSGQSCQELVPLASLPYTPPYVPPTPTPSPWGSETYWSNGYPSEQIFPIDGVAPTFAGIASLTIGSIGQLSATWLAASDPSTPIRYEVYVKAGNSTNLFNLSNITLVTTQLQTDIFSLPNGDYIQPDTYYVGVRATDFYGNRDSNAVILNITTTGIRGVDYAHIMGSFIIDVNNNLVASFWATDTSVVTPPRLGTGSYVIYDKNGTLVSGMSQSGIVPDANGFFKITPVASVLDLDNNFYIAKVSTTIGGTSVVQNVPVTYATPQHSYEPRGVFSINASNELQGTLWIVKNGEQMVSSLGTATYTIYDKDGNTIGITESGIVADANGYFFIDPVSASAILDLTHYTVVIEVVADGVTKVGSIGITLGE